MILKGGTVTCVQTKRVEIFGCETVTSQYAVFPCRVQNTKTH